MELLQKMVIHFTNESKSLVKLEKIKITSKMRTSALFEYCYRASLLRSSGVPSSKAKYITISDSEK